MRKSTVFCALALLAWGCKVGPDYKAPDEKLPAAFSESGAATRPTTRLSATSQPSMASEADLQQWWTQFNDPQLNSLIQRATLNNLDVIAAVERIREARANRGVVASALYPQVNADGSYSHIRDSANTPGLAAFSGPGGGSPGLEFDLWQAALDATWEIDVFGGTRRAVESAEDSIQAAVEDHRAVLIAMTAEVAANYVELRGAQRQLAIAQTNLQSQQETLNLTRSKAEGGVIPYLNVAQQEAQVDSTAATIPAYEQQIHISIHALGVLLGMDPGALTDELLATAPIPQGPSFVPPGIPSDLLRRRPDIREAERQLAAATANIGVATADLYPKFSLTGAFGAEAGALKDVFKWKSRDYQIVPGVTWDIFDAGRVNSNIKVENSIQAQALTTYRKVVLQSMEDVDDSLVAYNREQVRLQYLHQAVDANQKSVDLSLELFDKGREDFLSVLDAQRDLFAAQSAAAQSEAQVSTDLIALYKALGGGWTPDDQKQK